MVELANEILEKTIKTKERYEKLRENVKKQGHHFVDKSLYIQIYGF